MIRTSNEAGMPLKAMLIEAALAIVSSKGLIHLSLRGVAAAVGRSTTTIFQHFGNKDGLLAAVVETALDRDMHFHARFAEKLSGLSPDAATLTAVVAQYVESRASSRDPAITIWSELMFNGGHSPILPPLLKLWQQCRERFWLGLIPPDQAERIAPLISDYAVMEGAYAAILHEHLDYRLLLRETIAHLLGGACGTKAMVRGSTVHAWLANAAPPALPRAVDRTGTLGGHLLGTAAAEIFAGGMAALNHRRLTAKAGVSTAMINYHFGSMEQFAVEAIWHALLTGLPPDLDVSLPPGHLRHTHAEWAEALAETLITGAPTRQCGFYVSYSRIVGQTCLLARHRAEFQPLVRHLRLIEGMGIHHASLTSWPIDLAADRGKAAALAIWIKGWAMTAESIQDDGETLARLDAVRQLLSINPAKTV